MKGKSADALTCSLPKDCSCCLKRLMFFSVVTRGCVPVWMAYCSAGSPKASQPMGCRTLYPCRCTHAADTAAVYVLLACQAFEPRLCFSEESHSTIACMGLLIIVESVLALPAFSSSEPRCLWLCIQLQAQVPSAWPNQKCLLWHTLRPPADSW